MDNNQNEMPDFIKRLLNELEGQYNSKKEDKTPELIKVNYECDHLPHPRLIQIMGKFNISAN